MKILALLILFSVITTIEASTPYKSLDRNDYYSVIKALKRPEWIFSYCEHNFTYYKDDQLYNKGNWVVSGRTMFQRQKGDCDDYAEFIYDVLKYHKYNPLLYWVWSINSGHAIVVFKYRHYWRVIDNIGFDERKFNSKEDAINSMYRDDTIFTLNVKDDENFTSFNVMDEDTYYDKNAHYINSDRLILHSHLTKVDAGIYFFTPAFSYIESLHKEAIGCLFDVDSFWLNKIGFSISGHGFYADNFIVSEKMYSTHFLFLNSKIGISYYFGDFNGIDVDVKILDNSRLGCWVCCRNFDEIIDIEINFSLIKDVLVIVGEKIDKEYLYGVDIYLLSDKVVRYNINNINTSLSMDMDIIKVSFGYNFKFGDLSFVNIDIIF